MKSQENSENAPHKFRILNDIRSFKKLKPANICLFFLDQTTKNKIELTNY